jgi:hypothetical protein
MLIPISLAAPAVRLELTGGDLGDLRRSHRRGYGAPSWIRTNIVGLEGRLPVRRPGRSGAGERSRTVPCLVGNDAAHHARPRDVVAAAGFAPATSDLSGRCSSA